MVTITERAAKKISEILKEENKIDGGIRVGVKGGGCSGLSYSLAVDDKTSEDDQVFEEHGVKLYVDAKSFLYIAGTELDYTDGLNGSGFKFENPNASRTCGCGSSFGV
jgi:iron-sulfur cluster assembly protein